MGEIWQALLGAILEGVQFFYRWVNDYGFAIILLTVAFRVILIPLTWKQTKSMYELQRIQPKIKALQEKYKNDKEKQQEELMKFYQENKVNPFGGCLPLLLQMPLFFALFDVLRTKLPEYIKTMPVALQGAAKQWWIIIPDITKSPQNIWQDTIAGGVGPAIWAILPYAILVILFGVSVWLPQYLMTQDPQQRRTGSIMAVMMLWFGFATPAGVLIYWVTSSGWQVAQQIITQRMLDRQNEAEQPAVEASGKAKAAKALKSDSEPKTAKPDGEGKSAGSGKATGKSKKSDKARQGKGADS